MTSTIRYLGPLVAGLLLAAPLTSKGAEPPPPPSGEAESAEPAAEVADSGEPALSPRVEKAGAVAASDASGVASIGGRSSARAMALSGAICAPECLAAYAKAFTLLAEDRPSEAARLLRATMPAISDPMLLSSAATLLDLAEERSAYRALNPPSLMGRSEDEGRFSVVAWTTAGSITAGTLLGAMLELDDARSNVLLTLAFTGTGLWASLLGTSGLDLAPGTPGLYGTGLVAGAMTAWNVSRMLELSPRMAAGLGIGGLAAGGALGYVAGQRSAGGAATSTLVASSFLWGSTIGVLLLPVVQPADDLGRHAILLGGSALGLAGGALAASRVEMSRSRVLLVDLGALVGGLALGGLGIAILDDQPAALVPRVVPIMTIAGILGGGSLAMLLTRDLEGGRDAGGGSAGALIELRDGSLRAGAPAPLLLPEAGPGGAAGLGLTIFAGEI